MVIKNGKILLFEQNGFVPRDIRIENGKDSRNFRSSGREKKMRMFMMRKGVM